MIEPERPTTGRAGSVTALGLALSAVLLVLVFHSPRLWLMDEVRPGTFQWDRALTFLSQCEDPFRADVEPAMRFRLGPPLVAYAGGLRGGHALVLPWIGVLFFLTYVAKAGLRETGSRRGAWLGTLLVASTSAVLVPTHWFGINDAWVWLGLTVVAISPRQITWFVAALLVPWVDERFLIGLPLALAVRYGRSAGAMGGSELWPVLGILPYVVVRLWFAGMPFTNEVERSFLSQVLAQFSRQAGLAPLAWWMGLRLAWIPLIWVFLRTGGAGRVGLLSLTVITALISTLLAADMSRSSAILIPLVIWGWSLLAAEYATWINRHVVGITIAVLAIPAVHVVGRKIDPIENIAVEILRLLTN